MQKSFHVLMADDDPDDHQFFREALREIKIGKFPAHEIVNLTSVYNGVQAIDYLLRRGIYAGVKDPVPDFIVLDLNMPIMDGFTVLKEITAHVSLKHIPVYILTTSLEEADKEKCRRLGCGGFFSKPPRLEELSTVILKMLYGVPE
jgi:two-component system response regulator